MLKFQTGSSEQFVGFGGCVVVGVSVGPAVDVADVRGFRTSEVANRNVDVPGVECVAEFVSVDVWLGDVAGVSDGGADTCGGFGGFRARVCCPNLCR